MTRVCRWLLILISATIMIAPTASWPDLGPVIKVMGGAAAPKSPHKTIQLESQEVTIRLRQADYVVEAEFHFFNHGTTRTEWVGFPGRFAYKPGYAGLAHFKRFDTWVDSRQVSVSEEPDRTDRPESNGFESSNQWMVARAKFPGNSKTKIRIRYEAEYHHYLTGSDAYYVYGTGTYWKDSIGRAVFTVDGSDIAGSSSFEVVLEKSTSPSRQYAENHVVRIEFTELKPDPSAALRIQTRDMPPDPAALLRDQIKR